MEDNFRNTLIILSGVVITAIFVHGLWTIRKQKNPYKLKTGKEKREPISRDFDRSGFDQDGVSQIKVLKQDNEPYVKSEKDFEQSISLEEISHLENGQNDESYNVLSSKVKVPEHEVNFDLPKVQKNSVDDSIKIKEKTPLIKPVYKQPVTQAKPVVAITKAKTPSKTDEITTIDLEPQIIILSVVMPANHQISGAELLPTLLTLGMKYGEMNIFHRHQDNAGNGAVTFSLANMLNPGVFDLDSMESFVTQGVSLFMTLPNAGDPFATFDQMLVAAKQLAQEFNAQLLDDKRNIMTKQTEQHYVSKIREFDRKHRLASVE